MSADKSAWIFLSPFFPFIRRNFIHSWHLNPLLTHQRERTHSTALDTFMWCGVTVFIEKGTPENGMVASLYIYPGKQTVDVRERFSSLCGWRPTGVIRSFKSPNLSSLERTHAAPLISDRANDLLGKHRVRTGKLKKVLYIGRREREQISAGIVARLSFSVSEPVCV